jgi:hypothetical protein
MYSTDRSWCCGLAMNSISTINKLGGCIKLCKLEDQLRVSTANLYRNFVSYLS